MTKIPIFKIVFSLVKADVDDFERETLSKILNLIPTETSPPTLSKGRLYCNNVADAQKELSGITVLVSDEQPYKMIKNAFWRIELPKVKSFCIEEPLEELKQIVLGKEEMIVKLCQDYNLFVDLAVNIYANSNNTPVMSLSAEDIFVLARIKASIHFDLHLD